jgi:hypothetical protein
MNPEEHIPDADKGARRFLIDELLWTTALVEAQGVYHCIWFRIGWGVIHRHRACAHGARPYPFIVTGSARLCTDGVPERRL